MNYPATAEIVDTGTGSAAVHGSSGFGEAFGESFGGYVAVATANVTATTTTATLAGNGIGAAIAEEVLVSAELQLV